MVSFFVTENSPVFKDKRELRESVEMTVSAVALFNAIFKASQMATHSAVKIDARLPRLRVLEELSLAFQQAVPTESESADLLPSVK